MTNKNILKGESEPSEKLLVEALKQSWLHFRHIENQRLQFTYVYSILVVAALTILMGSGLNTFRITYPYSLFLVGFVILLSFLGYLLTLRANFVLFLIAEKIKKTAHDLNLANHMALWSEKGIWKIVKVRNIFELFYAMILIGWITVFLYMVFGNLRFLLPVWMVLAISLTIVLIAFRSRLRIRSVPELSTEF